MASSTPVMTPSDLERLVSTPMPFGRYAGCLIADLPSHYLAWFVRENTGGGTIARLIGLMYEIDHNDMRAWLDPLRAAHRTKTRP